MMKIIQIPVGYLETNCYLAICSQTGKALVVDPGDDSEKISLIVNKNKADVVGVVLTHGHADHIGALDSVNEKWRAKTYIHEADADMLFTPEKNLSTFLGQSIINKAADVLLHDEDEIKFGECTLRVMHTPGHTVGSISLYGENVLISGDTLFAGSVGRTDFLGGSFPQLMQSIKGKLMQLPDDVIVYPGHYEPTTIGQEKKSNSFIR